MERILQAYLDDLEVAGNVQQLRAALTAVTSGLGVQCYAYIALPASPHRPPRLISTSDPRWAAHYQNRRYHRSDPIVLRSLRDPRPFGWGADTIGSDNSKFIRDFFHEAASFGIASGLTISMGPWRAGRAALTFASDRRLPDFRHSVRHCNGELRMIAYDFHKHVRRLVAPGYSVDGIALSLRQVQCLEWIATGKAIAEVASLLGTKRSTAKYHLEVVRNKLNVRNSAQAVAALARLVHTV